MKATRRFGWLALAGVALVTMAASSPQCARTDDLSVNPSLNSLTDGNLCVQDCIAAYRAAKTAELADFKLDMAACNGDPDCRYERALMHESIVMELEADKDACIMECEHQQGSGTSGQ